jgi:hypothetical protein
MTGVLITANVFQNGLSKSESDDYLRKLALLANLPVSEYKFYISAIDHRLAFFIPEYYGLNKSQPYNDICEQIKQRLLIIDIDKFVREEAKAFSNLNYFDAIRLACALQPCLDINKIVTYELHQFVRYQEEMFEARKQGFFDYEYEAEDLESGQILSQIIRVHDFEQFVQQINNPVDCAEFQGRFGIGNLEIQSTDRDSPTFLETRVSVDIYTLEGQIETGNALCRTPVETLYQAIDDGLSKLVNLPPRSLTYYWVPGVIGNPASEVEVVIRVQCEDLTYETAARNVSIIRAFGDAYVKAVNYLVCDLGL